MSGGANYVNYQNAFNKIKRSKSPIIPSSGLADQSTIELKEATISPVAIGLNKQTKRETGDIMMKVNNYSFIECPCGLKIKIPPDYKKNELFCPRCGRNHVISA
jgi:heat shock protein HtpX